MVLTIGILGGGQLGMMLAQEIRKRNGVDYCANVLVYDDSFDCPCAKLSSVNYYKGSLQDAQNLEKFCRLCDVVTFEIEHVNCDPLIKLEDEGTVRFVPSPKVVKLIQNKATQKEFFARNQLPTARFDLNENDPIYDSGDRYGWPLVLKLWESGYDGHGVQILHAENSVQDSFEYFSEGRPVVVEEFIKDAREISVVVARTKDAQIAWTPVEMHFQTEHNILDYLECPANIEKDVEDKATKLALKAVEALNGIGVFAVEMFLRPDNTLLINEIAPRPHNSCHHTIHASDKSVYQALVNILTSCCRASYQSFFDSPPNTQPCYMYNILGPNKHTGLYSLPASPLHEEGDAMYIVDYQKTISRPLRKLGHCTVIGTSLSERVQASPYLKPMVSVIMGSTSDWPTMKKACDILDKLDVRYEKWVISAHRTPDRLYEFAKLAKSRQIGVIIAGAGGAAHLPGMVASLTHLPVIGVPVKSSTLSGVDSLHSIVQMPPGVPVATVAIGGATNAGILAAQILGVSDVELGNRIQNYKNELKMNVTFSANNLSSDS